MLWLIASNILQTLRACVEINSNLDSNPNIHHNPNANPKFYDAYAGIQWHDRQLSLVQSCRRCRGLTNNA